MKMVPLSGDIEGFMRPEDLKDQPRIGTEELPGWLRTAELPTDDDQFQIDPDTGEKVHRSVDLLARSLEQAKIGFRRVGVGRSAHTPQEDEEEEEKRAREEAVARELSEVGAEHGSTTVLGLVDNILNRVDNLAATVFGQNLRLRERFNNFSCVPPITPRTDGMTANGAITSDATPRAAFSAATTIAPKPGAPFGKPSLSQPDAPAPLSPGFS